MQKKTTKKKWFPIYRSTEFSKTSDMQETVIEEFNLEGDEEKKLVTH